MHLLLGIPAAVKAAQAGGTDRDGYADLKARAEKGDAAARFNLAVTYEDGLGVTRDQAKAVKWYQGAAEQNQVGAQFKLGFWYEIRQGVTKDEALARQWFRKAAKRVHAVAQFNIGDNCSFGRWFQDPLTLESAATFRDLTEAIVEQQSRTGFGPVKSS